MSRFVTLALASLLTTSTVQAQLLLSDNFDSENGGNSAANYVGFANWTVTGQVDLLKSGTGGITCQGGTGVCVDLDGSTGPGRITTKNFFAFGAGDRVRFQFGQSGNQRSPGTFDGFEVKALFSTTTTLTGGAFSVGGFTGAITADSWLAFAYSQSQYAWDAAWSTGFVEFDAAQAGSVQFTLSTSSSDRVGPLVDNVVLTATPATVVPEPSAYALMAAGLVGVGVVARRRRR
ncbi:MAG: PEP-CTERM sorting domain-containing protein [Gemmatimonadaceae bacterium]|jgi:hypothetical protein|nr:PEP-CTERM sorting domain-containing protein [Gemmatimonadaceae bacterium]